jgi:hypothetical protein
MRSASTSELPKQLLSPEKELILPSLKDPELLSVQIETVWLNRLNMNNLVENVLQMVLKLTEEVEELRKENEFLKSTVSKIVAAVPISLVQTSSSAHCEPLSSAAVTDVPVHVSMSSMSSVLTSAESGVKSYRDVVTAGLQCKEFPGPVTGDGFITVTHKKKSNQVTSVITSIKQHRQPLIGVRNCVSLPVVSKKERSKALFILCFSPEVVTVEVEKSLREQLSLNRLVCARLRTKFNSYASLHVLVNEDDFPLDNSTGVWPNGCLLAPFYGKLTPDQMYSSSTPVKITKVGAPHLLQICLLSLKMDLIPIDYGSV